LTKENHPNKSLNILLLAHGYAKLDKSVILIINLSSWHYQRNTKNGERHNKMLKAMAKVCGTMMKRLNECILKIKIIM
jgi:hypothetical protein